MSPSHPVFRLLIRSTGFIVRFVRFVYDPGYLYVTGSPQMLASAVTLYATAQESGVVEGLGAPWAVVSSHIMSTG